MNQATALAGVVTLLCCAIPAMAGVVITQEQTTTSGINTRKSVETIMVQGNKQKVVIQNRAILLSDVDKGKSYVLDPSSKTYFEMEIPPKGPMAAAMMAATGASAQNLKKSGNSRTVAGYKCNDYQGAGHMMAGDYTVTECFSKDAPGAAEFAAYQKAMREKLKGSPAAMVGELPEGVPLESDATIKRKIPVGGPFARQTPQAGSQPQTEMKTVVSKTLVTKIVVQDLPPDTFSIPSDYQARELRVPGLTERPIAPRPPSGPGPLQAQPAPSAP